MNFGGGGFPFEDFMGGGGGGFPGDHQEEKVQLIIRNIMSLSLLRRMQHSMKLRNPRERKH